MKFLFKLIAIFLVGAIAISGCALIGGGLDQNSRNIEQTSVAKTVVGLQTVMAATLAQNIAIAGTEAVQNAHTMTPPPSPTTTAYPWPTATPQPYYQLSNIEDVTVLDNTVFQPGQPFTKTWKITNTGTQSWKPDFKLVFVNGDAMGALESIAIGKTIAPNATLQISVNLTAPHIEGTYQGYFMLQTSDGFRFGFGDYSGNAFWVKIKVASYFEVFQADIIANPTSYTGACPATIKLQVKFSSSTAGTITYHFVTSTTGDSKVYNITFTSGGTKTSDAIDWPIPLRQSGSFVVYVYVDKPNNQDFPSVTIPITCTS